MKKRLIAVMTAVLTIGVFVGCGNHTIIDTTYTFRYGIISLPDGTIVEGKVDRWCDYEGEQLQVTINGQTYLTSSYNCVLMANAPE